MIRPAKPQDVEDIVRLGIESLKKNGYEEWFVISEEKVRRVAQMCVSSPQHFAWVSEVDGDVVGAVVAMSDELMFFERRRCVVLMLYCRVAKDGGWLVKRLYDWYKSRRGLKYLEFTLDSNMDTRIGKFLERIGLEPDLPVYNDIRCRAIGGG